VTNTYQRRRGRIVPQSELIPYRDTWADWPREAQCYPGNEIRPFRKHLLRGKWRRCARCGWEPRP
jgi:hypothetical protein